jgi:dienelactone hydrolase
VRLSLAIASLVVLLGAAVVYSRLPGTRETGVFNVDPPTPYFHYPASGGVRGRVLAIHGLNANKSMLNLLSRALADSGLEVFTIDLPGHGRSTAPFNAVQARQAVAQVLDQLGPATLVLGHSLGGGLLLDVTSDHPVKSMVLFSPAPVPIDKIMANRILLFEGEFDPGRIRAFVPQIQAAAQGTVEYHDVRWTGHSGALTRPDIIDQTAVWLGGNAGAAYTLRRLSLLLLMLTASLLLGTILLSQPAKPCRVAGSTAPSNASRTIVAYVAATAVSALVLAGIPFTAWLQLFATDYLIGYLFLAGLLLCLVRFRIPEVRGTFWVGIAAALFMILVPGVFVVSEFTQVTLSDGRWWRFPAIAMLSLPLFWADETLIRPMQPRWKAVATGIVTRLIMASIVVTAALTIHREAAFLLLLILVLVIFWIALWCAGELVYRRTADPLATAIFLSLMQGWVFAAVLVTT